MSDLKDKIKGGHGAFVKFVIAGAVVFLLFVLFKPGSNIFNWIDARREIARQEKQIAEYERTIEMLKQKIDLLTSDRDTLEKFAREQFHFAAPGEDVYIIKGE